MPADGSARGGGGGLAPLAQRRRRAPPRRPAAAVSRVGAAASELVSPHRRKAQDLALKSGLHSGRGRAGASIVPLPQQMQETFPAPARVRPPCVSSSARRLALGGRCAAESRRAQGRRRMRGQGRRRRPLLSCPQSPWRAPHAFRETNSRLLSQHALLLLEQPSSPTPPDRRPQKHSTGP